MKTMLRVFFLSLLCLPNFLRAQCPVVNLGADTLVCDGMSITLDAGNPGATYTWSTGETTQAINIMDGGQYHVAVSKNGCTAKDTVTVTAVPVLWSDFNFQKLTNCLPVKYKFTDNSSACESTVTEWFWEFGDGTTSTAQHPEHEFTSQAQFNVKLTVTDNNGNSIRRSKRITVTPGSLSVALGSDTTICFGNSMELDAGNAGATFNWSTGESTQKILVQDDGDYIVSVQSSGCVAKDTIRVNTSASVANKWSYVKNGGCLPINVAFTDSSVAFCNQQIQTWQWDFGDGTFSSVQHPVHTFHTADSFVVRLTVTTTSGATSTSTKKIGVTNSVHSVDIPEELKVCAGTQVALDAGVDNAEYTWSPSAGITDVKAKIASINATTSAWYFVDVAKCSVNVRDSVYVIADSTIKPGLRQDGNFLMSTSAYSYEWFKDGKKINGATQKNLRVDEQGYYQVKAISNGGCERMSDPKFFMPLSGKEKEDETIRIKCTPNPGPGKLNVLLSELPQKPASLTVYDRYGRIMMSTVITGNVTPVNLMPNVKGLYYVEVKINYKKHVMPVVVQ